jgi:transposase
VNEYTEAFKAKMVRQMLGPRARSASSLSSETGVSQPTLSRWLLSAQSTLGAMAKPQGKTTTSSARRAEDWPPEERLRVVVESSHLEDEELGAFLRAEGLHEATLRAWRSAALEGLGPLRPARGDQKRVRELEKELRRKDKALAEAAALLILQKKVQHLWGDGDDDTDPKSGE